MPDILDFQASQQRLEEEAAEQLAQKKRTLLGNFDTELPCNCGKANIIDHATGHDTKAPPISARDVRYGPQPTAREQNDGFRVYHAYSCDECGVEYRNDVIEGRRGYVPLEKRPAA